MKNIFTVRKYKTTSYKGKEYFSYRYRNEGCDWTCEEIEEFEGLIKFKFYLNMSSEDIDKIKLKWKHKLEQ